MKIHLNPCQKPLSSKTYPSASCADFAVGSACQPAYNLRSPWARFGMETMGPATPARPSWIGKTVMAALLALVGASLVPAAAAAANTGEVKGMAHRMERLETLVAQLQEMNAGQAAQVTQLTDDLAAAEARIAALETKTQDMTRLIDPYTLQPTIRLSGINLQVVNGSGDTESAVNGVGNLIVGYNESDGFSGLYRSGSHNLIVGSRNDFASYGGIVAGRYNTITGRYATVTAGSFNLASGFGSAVSGGDGNRATNTFSAVSGGFLNFATGDQSSVSGGVGVVQAGTFGWAAGSTGAAVSGAFRSP